jgi:hypothetical protein
MYRGEEGTSKDVQEREQTESLKRCYCLAMQSIGNLECKVKKKIQGVPHVLTFEKI